MMNLLTPLGLLALIAIIALIIIYIIKMNTIIIYSNIPVIPVSSQCRALEYNTLANMG